MNERKTPPSQQTLTQMSRSEDKRRKMDDTLLRSIRNCQSRQHLSVRVKSTSFGQSQSVSESHTIGRIHSSSEDDESSDEDFISKRTAKRGKLKKRYTKKQRTDGDDGEVVEAVVLDDDNDDDAPLSPCLLPAVEVTPRKKESVWSFDPGQSPPEKEYLDVSTHKWILEYNRVLKRAKHYERQCKYERRRATYYKRKLREIAVLSKTGPKDDSD